MSCQYRLLGSDWHHGGGGEGSAGQRQARSAPKQLQRLPALESSALHWKNTLVYSQVSRNDLLFVRSDLMSEQTYTLSDSH